MLRLSRDRLLISLAPETVMLARLTGGWRPRLVARQAVECDPGYGTQPWQGAVAALGTALEPLRRQSVQATVVLSNALVRYCVVPFDRAVTDPREDLALARFHFTRVHGERAKTWDLRLSPGTYGAPRIASAVDPELIREIRACFPRSGAARLGSVQPYLMSAFNQWRRALPKGGAWLLLLERERACLALADPRLWTGAQTSRGSYAAPEDWAALLDRQSLRMGSDTAPRTVLVHDGTGRKTTPAQAGGWSFLPLTLPPLEGFLPLQDGRLAMALSAR